ncbi:uncharacterized protein N7477_001968 [Penicillium maclennaniae]|uniref:uncharacterized protein n=1 Tax=Penicillium maclennaniae TaxID=1343394 RepID=UPI002540D81A|nr:uncharacterized protein N7477_001968 [Penicillium maclennaniae]KAJ5682028.1 hypothetical protein N7477_001968 [Penicillium maclennaniae]
MPNHRICLRALKTQPSRSLSSPSCRVRLNPLRTNLATTRLPYSTTGYGDGEGDPRGQDPTSQGVNQRSRELEHPGPEQVKQKDSSQSNQSEHEAQGKTQEKKERADESAKANSQKARSHVK